MRPSMGKNVLSTKAFFRGFEVILKPFQNPVSEGLKTFGNGFETLWKRFETLLKCFLKLINYSCRSYPTRASYSGQVDEFRNPMKTELKTRPCLKAVFQTRMQIFLICILIKQQKHMAINNYLITHFTKQTLNLNYLLLMLNVTVQLLNYPKQKSPFFS